MRKRITARITTFACGLLLAACSFAPKEYVIVTYPVDARLVFVDGKKGGFTNKVFSVDGGTRKFDLGENADYEPPFWKLEVEGTSIIKPKKIPFYKKKG